MAGPTLAQGVSGAKGELMNEQKRGKPRSTPVGRLLPAIALMALLGLALLSLNGGGERGAGGLLEVQALAGNSPSGTSSADIRASATLSNTVFLPSIYRDYPCLPLEALAIDGPDSASIGVPQTFTVSAVPARAGQPITYTWQVTGQAPVVVVDGAQDVQTFTWELTGDKVIAVHAADRCGGSAAETMVVELTTRGLIAFERRYCRWVSNEKVCDLHDIWVRSHNGSGVEINLTNTPEVDEGVPTWSPDGHFLAYAAGPVGARAIYKMDLRTRQVTAVTDGSLDERWPAWSPLGDRIAFTAKTPGEMEDVYLVNTDGSGLGRLTTWFYGDRFPAWSRDGQWIAFSSERYWGGEDLWMVRPDDLSSEKVVLRTDFKDEIYPSWSPDGWIYHTLKDPAAGELLYRVRPGDNAATKVFDDRYQRYIPSFSPDGGCFVFYSYMGGRDKEVWKWCNGYSAAVNVTDNDDLVDDEFCAWSPVP
jgi:Tol biopolymer transport system component